MTLNVLENVRWLTRDKNIKMNPIVVVVVIIMRAPMVRTFCKPPILQHPITIGHLIHLTKMQIIKLITPAPNRNEKKKTEEKNPGEPRPTPRRRGSLAGVGLAMSDWLPRAICLNDFGELDKINPSQTLMSGFHEQFVWPCLVFYLISLYMGYRRGFEKDSWFWFAE
jgi:hypothetical protein